MSVKKRNKVWNGLNVVEEVDTETGVISIKSRPTRSNPDGTVLTIVVQMGRGLSRMRQSLEHYTTTQRERKEVNHSLRNNSEDNSIKVVSQNSIEIV